MVKQRKLGSVKGNRILYASDTRGGGQGGGLAIFRNGTARFTKVPSKPESDKNVEKPSFFSLEKPFIILIIFPFHLIRNTHQSLLQTKILRPVTVVECALPSLNYLSLEIMLQPLSTYKVVAKNTVEFVSSSSRYFSFYLVHRIPFIWVAMIKDKKCLYIPDMVSDPPPS